MCVGTIAVCNYWESIKAHTVFCLITGITFHYFNSRTAIAFGILYCKSNPVAYCNASCKGACGSIDKQLFCKFWGNSQKCWCYILGPFDYVMTRLENCCSKIIFFTYILNSS